MRNFARTIALSMALCVVSLGAQGTTLGLQTTASEKIGAMLLIPIHIETSPSEPVASLQFDLHFDAQALQFSGVVAGEVAQNAEKSAHFNLMRPGVVRVIVAGLNRAAINTGLLAEIQLTATNSSLKTTTVTIDDAILSDPYGNALPATLSPNTVVLEQTDGILQASMATGTASSKPPGDHYATYRALFIALLCVAAAMAWSRYSTGKAHKR